MSSAKKHRIGETVYSGKSCNCINIDWTTIFDWHVCHAKRERTGFRPFAGAGNAAEQTGKKSSIIVADWDIATRQGLSTN